MQNQTNQSCAERALIRLLSGRRLVAVGSLLGYLCLHLAFSDSSRAGLFNYHMYLAEAFLNGSLSLVRQPPTTHDLSVFDGKLFLYWGPIPAVVLMPLVLLFGADWSDEWLTMGLGTLATTAIFSMLEATKRLHGLSTSKSLLLTLAFGFGSPCLPLVLGGTVWHVSQLFTTLFLALAVTATFRDDSAGRSYVVPGVLVGMACLTRASAVGAVAWLLAHVYAQARSKSASRLSAACATLPAISVLGALASLLLIYNFARFGSPLDNGVGYHQPDPMILEDIRAHGLFSFYYLPRNFFYHYIAYPFPASEDLLMGGSLFLMTPLYLGAFLASESKDLSRTVWGLWATVVLLAIPSLLLCGTGWTQLGPRYTLDYAPFLILLVAIGISRWSTQAVALFTAASVAQYLYGLSVMP
jgi:hypothetical protein